MPATQEQGPGSPNRILPSMTRILAALALVGLLATACTANESAEVVTSTSAATPVTTLPPPSVTTTTAAQTSTSSTTTTTIAPVDFSCDVTARTTIEGYTQGCEVFGLTILAGEAVEPSAVIAQAERVFHMLAQRPDLQDALVGAGLSGRVIGEDQRITDLSEFTELYDQYPGTDWDRRGRSFPGTDLVPAFAGAEENLLCLEGDRYEGEDEFVRSFALTIKRFALEAVDPATVLAIEQAYGRAIAQGLWENTLAEINADEYWMEGTQSYFDANLEDTAEEREPNSEHNAVNTRIELEEYDGPLFAIARSVYGDTEWRPTCG